MLNLRMEHIGSMSQVGEVLVWGLAQHYISESRTGTIYLNFAGPGTSVEAIWAKLIERRTTGRSGISAR